MRFAVFGAQGETEQGQIHFCSQEGLDLGD